jgi:hypothetical protein
MLGPASRASRKYAVRAPQCHAIILPTSRPPRHANRIVCGRCVNLARADVGIPYGHDVFPDVTRRSP